MKRIERFLPGFFLCVLLVGLGLLIYSNTFRASFHLDDIFAIVENPSIRDLGDLQAIRNAFNTRFIVGLSLALNYRLGGLDVLGYHFFNVAAHILASFLVYQLSVITLGTPFLSGDGFLQTHKKGLSALAAFLFLTHPIQTQAVTYIWQRAAVLATVFYLACLVFYAKARVTSSRRFYGASLICALAGMFCKETMITVPLAVAGYEVCFLGAPGQDRKKRFYCVLPFLFLLPVIPLTLLRAPQATLEIMRSPAGSIVRFVGERQMPRATYFLTQIDVLRTYLRLFLFPVNQNLDYDYPLAKGFFEVPTFLSFLLLSGVLVYGFRLYPKHRLASFGIGWFFLTLSVESLIPQNDVIFEHRLYLPMVGCSFFAAYWFYFLLARRSPRITLTAAILLIGTCGCLTYQRNLVWKDESSLWEDVIRKSPRKARAHNALGYDLQIKGRLDPAISEYDEAVRLKPDYAEVYSNRGVAYLSKGLLDRALEDFNAAIRVNSGYAQAYNNRGTALKAQGRLDAALVDFEEAIRINPGYAKAYSNRGSVYQVQGLTDRALADFDKAIRLDPGLAEAYFNRGVIYQAKGLPGPATLDFKKAIQLRPDLAREPEKK